MDARRTQVMLLLLLLLLLRRRRRRLRLCGYSWQGSHRACSF
jgi:hypothetical protein